jgi:TPR repeat protein
MQRQMNRCGMVLRCFGLAYLMSTTAVVAMPDEDAVVMVIESGAPGADYGYTSDTPIQLGGNQDGQVAERMHQFLDLVHAADEAELTAELIGDCCTDENNQGMTLQVFAVSQLGQRPFRLYVDGENEGPLYVPAGLLAAHSVAALAEIDDARQALRFQNTGAAIRALQPLAEAGDMMAQYLMAQSRMDRQQYTEALTWYRLAAEQGHNVSQAVLASLLQQGIGTDRDEAAAQTWLRRAAANGHAGARLNIALSLLTQDASDAQKRQGATLLAATADQGDVEAQAAYGMMLYEGTVLPENRVQGLVWLYLARQSGHANATTLYRSVTPTHAKSVLDKVELIAGEWLRRDAPAPAMALSMVPTQPSPPDAEMTEDP